MSIRRRYISGQFDYTFKYSQFGSGFRISVYDNNLDTEITLDDIKNENVERYYVNQLIDLTKQKLRRQLITV